MTQKADKGAGDTIRVALIGGSEEGLLTLASLTQDPSTEVVMLVDQDQKALAFRLHEYGFTFEKIFTFTLTSDIESVKSVSELDLIIDASGDPKVRQELHRLNHPRAKVMSSQAARVLWEIKSLPPRGEGSAGLSLEQAGPYSRRENILLSKGSVVLSSQASLHPQPDLIHFLIEAFLLSLEADWSAIYLFREGDRRLVPASCSVRRADGAGGTRFHPEPGISRMISEAIREKKGGIFLTPPFPEFWTSRLMTVLGFQQYIAVPFFQRDRFIGFLELGRGSTGANWERKDAEFVERLLSQKEFSAFLSSLELESDSFEPLLRSLKVRLEQSGTLQENLEAATSEIQEFIRSSSLSLFVKDPESGDLVLQSRVDSPIKMNGLYRMKPDDGIGGLALRNGEAIFFREEEKLPGNRAPMGIFYLPLIVQSHAVGLLILEFRNLVKDPAGWKEKFAEVTDLLALSIASDVERRYMAQKVMKLTVVNEEGLELVSTTDRDKVLMMASASVAMIAEAEAAVLRIREKESARLLVGYTYGLHHETMDKLLIQIDAEIAAAVAESRQVQMSPLARLKGRLKETIPEKFPYHSVLSLPLLDQNELIGTLSVYNKIVYNSFSPGTFNETDRELLEKYGSYIGKALVRAKEYQIREKLITIDELTGLKNERYLNLRLPEELRRAERHKRKLSLLLLDLDKNRKEFTGVTQVIYDSIAQNIGRLIYESFRNVDIVVRLKGARFAVLLPDTGRKIGDTLNRLNESVSALKIFTPKNERVPLHLLTGYATYPDDAITGDELVRKASALSPYGVH